MKLIAHYDLLVSVQSVLSTVSHRWLEMVFGFLCEASPPSFWSVIALIDYGAGNLRSVHKALLHLGAEVRLVRQAEELDGCPGIVLPGVGAFDDCSLSGFWLV